MSLRARLLVGVAMVLIALLGAGVSVLFVQQRFLVDQIDDRLRAFAPNARFLVTRAERGGSPVGGPPAITDTYVAQVDREGQLTALVVPIDDPKLSIDVSDIPPLGKVATIDAATGSADQVRVTSVPLRAGSRAVFALSLDRADAAFSRLVVALAAAALVVVAVLTLVVWWVVSLGLRPIRAMTEAADAIAGGAVDRRVRDLPGKTEAARLGHALNVMIDTNQASEARLRRFVADASHELRTPLTTLQGYTALYAAGGYDDNVQVDDAMRRIREESTRMGGLVENLLLLAELDEQPTLEREPVDLRPILDDLAADMRAVQPGRPVTVEAPTGLAVVGDRDRLTQAIAAFTTNAIRHTPPESQVTLRGTQTEATVRVAIEDRGAGVMPGDVAKLFDRFYRADRGRARASGGNGLGLAIASSIARAHGGECGVSSKVGEGSTFWIELPRPSAG